MQLLTCPKCHLTWYEYSETDKCPYCKQPLVTTQIFTEYNNYRWESWFGGSGDSGWITNQINYDNGTWR